MSNEAPPNPLTNTYQPSAWEEEDTSITKENIGLYAVTFPISQNSPITISNTLSVGGLITGTTATATANDNSTKLASTSYADNSSSQSASALLADTNTWSGINTFSNTNNNFTGSTSTQSQGETDTTKLANLAWVTTRVNNTAIGLASLSLNNTFTGVNTFNDDVFIGGGGLLTCGQVNSGEIIGLAPTQSAGDNSTKLSTTAYADTSSSTATNTLQNVLLTGNLTYSGNNSYTGTTTLSGTNNIGVLNGTNNLAGNVNINTANPNNNTTIGNSSGGGALFINGGATFSGTTNLNGAVNATSTNNKIIGNVSGGITQINGTTEINSANVGNTNIGSAGGGTTTITGTTNLNGNFTRDLTTVKRWGISGGGGNADYGTAGNRIGSTLFRTSGTTSFTSVTASGGAIASAWNNPNGFFTFPETGTYIINVILFTNGGKIQSGVGAYAGGGGSFIDGTGFIYLFNDNTTPAAGSTTTINTATFLYCANGSSNTFYIGSGGTGSCVIYTGVAHSSITITKVG